MKKKPTIRTKGCTCGHPPETPRPDGYRVLDRHCPHHGPHNPKFHDLWSGIPDQTLAASPSLWRDAIERKERAGLGDFDLAIPISRWPSFQVLAYVAFFLEGLAHLQGGHGALTARHCLALAKRLRDSSEADTDTERADRAEVAMDVLVGKLDQVRAIVTKAQRHYEDSNVDAVVADVLGVVGTHTLDPDRAVKSADELRAVLAEVYGHSIDPDLNVAVARAMIRDIAASHLTDEQRLKQERAVGVAK